MNATTALLMLAAVLSACRGERAPDEQSAPPVADSDVRAVRPPVVMQGPSLAIRTSPTHGDYLTDGAGRALYLLEDKDEVSACAKSCLATWPPLLAGNSPSIGGESGIIGAMIGTTPREALVQITYNGHPLYYYAGDRNAGDTAGQHVEDKWGGWYLVGPSGRKVEDR